MHTIASSKVKQRGNIKLATKEKRRKKSVSEMVRENFQNRSKRHVINYDESR